MYIRIYISIFIYHIYIHSEPTISSDNGKTRNHFGEAYMDIPDEIVVKKIANEEEEEKEKEKEGTNLVGNRHSGCRIDETQRYFLF